MTQATDLDQPCPHVDFDATVTVNRLTRSDDDPTVIAYNAEIRVNCAGCGEPFRWTGLRAGFSTAGPRCSIDEKTLHAPLRPASADPDFGLGVPGFAIAVRGGPIEPAGGMTPTGGDH